VKTILAAAFCASLSLAPAQSASAHEFTIRGDHRIGSFAVKEDGTLGGAIQAFGRPGDKHRNGSSCTVRWGRHGLKILFYNLGGENPCSPDHGFFARARMQGPHWQTNRGLEIGDRRRKLRNLYPNARYHAANPGFWPAGWWLVPRSSPFGSGGSYPGLLARMAERRVSQFHVRHPAGGD
jgi:hypothetical protein